MESDNEKKRVLSEEEIAARNKRLTDPVWRLSLEEFSKVNAYEREAMLSGRTPSRRFSTLMDAVLMFRIGIPVGQLQYAYQALINTADSYIKSPGTDINPEEKIRWAGELKSQAQEALAWLKSAISNGDFTDDETRLPAGIDYFSSDTGKIKRNAEMLQQEQKLDKVPFPKDYDYDKSIFKVDSVLYPEAAADIIKRKINNALDLNGIEEKLTILADVCAASDAGLIRPGYDDTVKRAALDSILTDENGNPRPVKDLENIKNTIGQLIARWRVDAYRKIKDTNTNDPKWSEGMWRSKALGWLFSTMKDSVQRYGISFEDMPVIANDYMKKETTEEEMKEIAKIGLDSPDGVSNVRKYALDSGQFKSLTERIPDVTMGQGYVDSLMTLNKALKESAGIYEYSDELRAITDSMDTLSKMALRRTADACHTAAASYSSRTAGRIRSFMEQQALDPRWYGKNNTVRDKLLDMMRFTDQESEKQYLLKEELLKQRAEDLSRGREELSVFFNRQSGASRDTLDKLIAANGDKKSEALAKMGTIIEKRYGLGRELSLELAKHVKETIDEKASAGVDPARQFRSTAKIMRAALASIPNVRLNDYRISRKGSRLKADNIPKLREENFRVLESVENPGDDGPVYADRLKGLLVEPESFDRFKEMFDTKKNYRLLNWNSSEYNNAKEALDSFIHERDKLLKMTQGYEGGDLSDEKKTEISDQIKLTGEKRDRCINTLRDYIEKEGMGDISAKSQAAGYARITGAMGIMDIFIKNDSGLKGILPEEMQNAVNNDRVKVKSYAELYQEEFKKAEKAGEKDRHRTAAKAAAKTAKAAKQNNGIPAL